MNDQITPLLPPSPPQLKCENTCHITTYTTHDLYHCILEIVSEVSYLYLTYDVGCTVYINDIDHKLMNVRCPSIALICILICSLAILIWLGPLWS